MTVVITVTREVGDDAINDDNKNILATPCAHTNTNRTLRLGPTLQTVDQAHHVRISKLL